jgi:hypothetical protein
MLTLKFKVEESVVQSTAVIERKRAPAWNQEFIMYVAAHYSMVGD